MADTGKLLDHLDLERLTAEQAIVEIYQLSAKVLPHMSPVYYERRLAAINILARIAYERR